MATSSLLWKMALNAKIISKVKVAAGIWISLSRLAKLACKFLHNESPPQELLFLLPSKLQVVFSSNLFVVCKGHTSCTEAKLWCCWKIAALEFFSCWGNIIACFHRGIENERFLLARSFKRKKDDAAHFWWISILWTKTYISMQIFIVCPWTFSARAGKSKIQFIF